MGASMPKHAAPFLVEQIPLIALLYSSSVKPFCEPYHNANLRSDGDNLDLIQSQPRYIRIGRVLQIPVYCSHSRTMTTCIR